jgi:hypothetical protein
VTGDRLLRRFVRLIGLVLLIACVSDPAAASGGSVPVALRGPSLPLNATESFIASVDPGQASVDSVEFQYRSSGSATWTTFDTESLPTSSGEYTGTLDTTTLPDGNYEFQAVALGSSGPEGSSNPLEDQTVVNTSTYLGLQMPGDTLSGVAHLVAQPASGAAPPDTVTFKICPSSQDCPVNGGWQTLATVGPETDAQGNPVTLNGVGVYAHSLDTSRFPDGSYDITVSGEDASSDVFQGGLVTGVTIDNTPPTVSLDSPGNSLTGTVELSARAADNGTGVDSVKFQISTTGTSQWQTIGAATEPPYTFALDTRSFPDGSYDLRAVAADLAGNTATSNVLSSLTLGNPSSTAFSGLAVTNVQLPVTNASLIGELPGSEHETWAIGETDAPPPTVNGSTLPYTVEGDSQVVVLRYTEDGGWQIVDVLRNADGGAYQLQPGYGYSYKGSMAPNGEAWVTLVQTKSGSPAIRAVFDRQPGGRFLNDPAALQTLAPVLTGNYTLHLGCDDPGGTGNCQGPVYGAIFPGTNSQLSANLDQTVWTSDGWETVPVQLSYAVLDNDSWNLVSGSLPAGYVAPAGLTQIQVAAAEPTGPGIGWGAIEFTLSAANARMALTRFNSSDGSGWTLPQATGLDALDATGPISPDSQPEASAGGRVEITPTGLAADGDGGFVSATVVAAGDSGTVVAQFNGSGQVVDSWCDDLPSSYGCAQNLDADHPAIAPDAIFEDNGQQSAIGLSASGTLGVFTDGTWQPVAAPGFTSSGGASEVFADGSDGWITGSNAIGQISATPPASPLSSWPEANRDPLLSVALPADARSVDAGGALTVGLAGTALEFQPGAGWQSVGTPQAAHNLALTGVAYDGSSLAFAVGQAGTILRWGGSSWTADPESTKLTTSTLNSIAFGSNGQGWAVGAEGTILHYDGTVWSKESIDPADADANLTSVAVAGGQVFAVANGNLIERSSSHAWQRVPTAELPSPTPAAGSLDLVAGLPDGGLAIAGRDTVITRNTTDSGFQYSPYAFTGIPVALAAFRDSAGTVRVYVSVAPPVDSPNGGGVTDDTGGFPAGDGDLLLGTAGGWDDLSEDTPATTVSGPPADGTVHPDPVLGVAVTPDGNHAWVVGGYAGTPAADGVGSSAVLAARPKTWYSSSIQRYDAGGSVASPGTAQSPVTIPAADNTVNFAFLSSALCNEECSTVESPQPFVNLEGAASEISAYAQQPGGPAFAMIGGNAVGTMDEGSYEDGDGGIDLGHLPELLSSLSGVPTFAAYGPLDSVPTLSDPSSRWAQDFADSPAPFGTGGDPSSITPDGSTGDPSGLVNKYYAFDVTQNGGTLRAIVLDNSQGSLEQSAPGQTAWLASQLNSAQAQGEPVVVFAAEPLDSFQVGAASDADSVAAELADAGVLAVFTTAGGTTANGTSSTQTNQVVNVPADAGTGDPTVPEYEGATMTYQQDGNNGVVWYDVSVNTAKDSLSVQGVPLISSLALDPVDGLTVNRSSTLDFQAIGRRAASTIATGPANSTFPGYSQYVSIPASSCSTCISPSYTFTSSNPVVGNFVQATATGSNYPKLTGAGQTTPSSKSGLFCAFNAGTTVVTVTSGLMSASETVTVNPGDFGPPCGTVPGGSSTDIINIAGATQFEAGASPQGTPPIQPHVAQTVIPPIKVPSIPASTHSPAPNAPSTPPPYVPQTSSTAGLGVTVTPPIPAPITPVPPGGATAPAQSTAKREEKARKEASQSAYVIRPAGESFEDWFYPAVGGMTVLSLLLIAGGVRPGPKRAPAYARVEDEYEWRRND